MPIKTIKHKNLYQENLSKMENKFFLILFYFYEQI
jgi:hypothetical protein